MAKRIVLCCFHDDSVTTAANKNSTISNIQVVAGFTGDQRKTHSANLQWLYYEDDRNYKSSIFHNIDVVVNISNYTRIGETAQLAKHHNLPFICCATRLNRNHEEILDAVSRYVPVWFYPYDKTLDAYRVLREVNKYIDVFTRQQVGKVYQLQDLQHLIT